VWLHPGHTWARLLDDGTVAVGLDDLAHRLVAPQTVTLPTLGSRVFQGDPAVDLVNGEKSVSALAPVDGTVVAVNPRAHHMEEAANDPYGAGWLFAVKPLRLTSNLRQLQTGKAARKLVDESAALLAMRADPQMAAALQDGGAPVHGIAAALAGDEWDTFAREFLRS
jgi:glycine cleavage system H lipoate-binding protein